MELPPSSRFNITVQGHYEGDPFRLKWMTGTLVGCIPQEELPPGKRDATFLVESLVEGQIDLWRSRPESDTMVFTMSRNIKDPNFFLYTLKRLPDILKEKGFGPLVVEEISEDPPGRLELLRSMQRKVSAMNSDARDYQPPYDIRRLWWILQHPEDHVTP